MSDERLDAGSMTSPPVSDDIEGDWRPNPLPHRPMAGNTADDDGHALDQFFDAMTAGPQQYAQPAHSPESLPMVSRTISRTISLDNYAVGQPVLLLPADPRREYLHLEGFSPDLFFQYGETTPDGATTILDTSVNTLSSLRVIMQSAPAGSAGSLNINESADGVTYVTHTSRAISVAGTTQVSFDNPFRYLQITATAISASGTNSILVASPRAAQRYAWASDGLTSTSMAELVGPTDFAGYTGPVYVCRTVDEPTSVTAWVSAC